MSSSKDSSSGFFGWFAALISVVAALVSVGAQFVDIQKVLADIGFVEAQTLTERERANEIRAQLEPRLKALEEQTNVLVATREKIKQETEEWQKTSDLRYERLEAEAGMLKAESAKLGPYISNLEEQTNRLRQQMVADTFNTYLSLARQLRPLVDLAGVYLSVSQELQTFDVRVSYNVSNKGLEPIQTQLTTFDVLCVGNGRSESVFDDKSLDKVLIPAGDFEKLFKRLEFTLDSETACNVLDVIVTVNASSDPLALSLMKAAYSNGVAEFEDFLVADSVGRVRCRRLRDYEVWRC